MLMKIDVDGSHWFNVETTCDSFTEIDEAVRRTCEVMRRIHEEMKSLPRPERREVYMPSLKEDTAPTPEAEAEEPVQAEETETPAPAPPDVDHKTLIELVRSASNNQIGKVADILANFGVRRVLELKEEQLPAAYAAITEALKG